jgi:hypothetical protein
MRGTSAPSFGERRSVLVTALLVASAAASLGSAGCFGDPRNFHPDRGGLAGDSGGQGGYPTGGGQGGASGGSSMGSGATMQCSDSAVTAFSVRWALEDAHGKPVTCTAVGGATMDLDVLNLATSVASHDTFPCDAMAGTGAPLDVGDYSVAMRLYDANGTDLSQAIAPDPFSIAAGCTTDLGLVPFEAVVTTPDQYITLSWSVVRDQTNAPLSCADAQAATVELDASGIASQWPCGDGKGATPSLSAASYDVALKLLDASGTVLSQTLTMPVSVAAGQPRALGNVVFGVN